MIPSHRSLLPLFLSNFIGNEHTFAYGLLPQGRSLASSSYTTNDRFLTIELTSHVTTNCKVYKKYSNSYLVILPASERFSKNVDFINTSRYEINLHLLSLCFGQYNNNIKMFISEYQYSLVFIFNRNFNWPTLKILQSRF